MAMKATTQPPLLRDVIDIKPRISTSDYVLKLAEAVTPEGAAEALREYVITERLSENFDEALGLIRAALDGQTSKAAYLHGSFGSGKSHFMAVLHALLRGDPAARARNEFTDLIARHADWLGGGTAMAKQKNFLLVPYHMLGAKSLEQRVLGGYVTHIKALHPDAPTPQVYRTDSLIENIQATRRNVGDDLFISKLGSAVGEEDAADDEWGDSFSWTTVALDQAVAAQQLDQIDASGFNLINPTTPAELRAKLVHDALLAWFPGFFSNAAEDEYGFISLDSGLSVIGEHAKSLGYDGVILFLDELILWLANSIHDSRFVAREASKITNFVEGADSRRAVPIVSFIARQRDLRELVGEGMAGSAEAAIQDTLNLASGRFDTITLEDRNLPVIANKRLLQPINEEAAAALNEAFAKAKRVGPQVWDVLLGSEEGTTTGADEQSFRLTYPFSPAFMDTLVHISGALQRSRTGLKLMGQLLADHRDDARLEQLIPIGDLYQVIAAGGDEPFVEKLKAEFKAADKLYRTKLRPYLLDNYSITEDDVEQAIHNPTAITDTPLRNRCVAFMGDNRLISTLLLSALAPSVPALRDLTIRRLTALNHGSITSPIPGGELGMATSKVKEWATRFSEIKVTGSGPNWGVRLELVGVDVDSVIANANVNNNPGNRRALIKKLLWEELGVTAEGRMTGDEIPFAWRGSNRSLEVVFGSIANTDELGDHEFSPSEDQKWRMVVGMPFSENAFGSVEDANRVIRLRERPGDRPRTVCWIPAHFSSGRFGDFQRLVTIDAALSDPRRFETSYASHLSADNRQRAKGLLTDQRERLIETIKESLRQAYGLAQKKDTDVLTEWDEHLMPLPDITVKTSIGQSLRDATRHIAASLLAGQYPAHPDFDPENSGQVVKPADTKTVFGYIRAATETPDGRIEVAARDRALMRRVAAPLKLGVQHEAYFQLGRHWVEHFNRKAAEAAKTGDLAVVDLADWIDEPDVHGLDGFVVNLVIASYAEQTDRVWTRGRSVLDPPPELSQIKPGDGLREQPLPEQPAWEEAGSRFADIFGKRAPTLRRGRIVSHFAKQIAEEARQFQGPAHDLVAQLLKRQHELGLDEDDSAGRLFLARHAAELLDSVLNAAQGAGGSGKQVVTALASADLGGVPARRYGTSVKSAQAVTNALARANWPMLRLADTYGPEGQAVLIALRGSAQVDELTSSLVKALQDADRDIIRVIERSQAAARHTVDTPAPTPPAPITPPVTAASVDLGTQTSQPSIPLDEAPIAPTHPRTPRRSGSRRTPAAKLVAELRAELDELAASEPNAVVEISWRVVE